MEKVGKTEKPEDNIYEFDEEEGESETERTTISDLLNDIESKCPNYQRLLHVYVEKGEDAIVKVHLVVLLNITVKKQLEEFINIFLQMQYLINVSLNSTSSGISKM